MAHPGTVIRPAQRAKLACKQSLRQRCCGEGAERHQHRRAFRFIALCELRWLRPPRGPACAPPRPPRCHLPFTHCQLPCCSCGASPCPQPPHPARRGGALCSPRRPRPHPPPHPLVFLHPPPPQLRDGTRFCQTRAPFHSQNTIPPKWAPSPMGPSCQLRPRMPVRAHTSPLPLRFFPSRVSPALLTRPCTHALISLVFFSTFLFLGARPVCHPRCNTPLLTRACKGWWRMARRWEQTGVWWGGRQARLCNCRVPSRGPGRAAVLLSSAPWGGWHLGCRSVQACRWPTPL